jgi:hypothetical protein
MKSMILLAGSPPDTMLLYIVGLASGVFWSITYVLIILNARRDRVYGMPLAALCANIAWEFIETFIFPAPATGIEKILSNLINITWFGLDIFILVDYLRFWRYDFPPNLKARAHYVMLAFGIVVSFALIYGGHTYFIAYQKPIFNTQFGMVLASFGQNLMMSILFIAMLIRRNSTAGQSVWTAVAKAIGTAAASIYWYWLGAIEPMWLALYIPIFLFDCCYTIMLMQAEAKVKAPVPQTLKPAEQLG